MWNSRLFVFWILLFFEKPWVANGVEESRVEKILLKIASQPFAPIENVSEKCLNDSEIYFRDLYDYEPWALKMYDASVKIPSGLLTGNNKQLGNYEECLRIRTEYGFAGQACNANIQITTSEEENYSTNLTNLLIQIARVTNTKESKGKNNLTYDWMWCVPATCSSSEILQALDQRLNPLRMEGIKDGVNVEVKVNQVTCHSDDKNRVTLNIEDWIYIGIILLILQIVIASTTYDFIKRRGSGTFDNKDTKHLMLSSFSIYTNGKSLFSTERQGTAIDCLDGIRFFSCCWIIFIHTHSIEDYGIKLDTFQLDDRSNDLFFVNSSVATDIFLLMSATLLAYTLLMKNKKSSGNSLNLMQLYLHRYLRLTPSYAMVIGFYSTLFYKLGSGPKWDTWVEKNSESCRKNWWTNLLYINNYIGIDAVCIAQSWYLSVDMQLVWVSPIFLYPLLKLKRKVFFWIILTMGFIVSVIVPFIVTYYENLTENMIPSDRLIGDKKMYQLLYIKTYARPGPYIIGIGLGYLLFKTRSKKITLSWPYVLSGWILATILGFPGVLVSRELYYSFNKMEWSLFIALYRQAFAFAVSWVIFCINNGYGGPIGQFFSWRVWIPFRKLTYFAYLIHYMIMLYYAGRVMTSGNLSKMNVLRTYFGNLIITLLMSLILCLCFEMPFLNLDRVLNTRKPNFGAKTTDRNYYKRKSVGVSIIAISEFRELEG